MQPSHAAAAWPGPSRATPGRCRTITLASSPRQGALLRQQATLDALHTADPTADLTLPDLLPLASTPNPLLADAACALRDGDPAFTRRGGGTRLATFSPKAFLPLTRLCRDDCGYCTFVRSAPDPGRSSFMSLDAAVSLAAAAADAGCTEVLLTCGDAPETVHPVAADELAGLGHASTAAYAAAVAAAVTRATGLLVHSNVGLVSPAQAALLRQVTVSQGLMLETFAVAAAAGPGSPHDPASCPDKAPPARLASLAALAAARVPTTSGLLLGLGESRAETLAALLALRRLNQASAFPGGGKGRGFLQELIIQPFTPKAGTRMGGVRPPAVGDLLWAVSAARLVMGPGVAIQAPPNLAALLEATGGGSGAGGGGITAASAAAAGAAALLKAGACDFGGISPITADHISPDAPWPPLAALADAAAAAGLTLAPRLPVYPPFFMGDAGEAWLDGSAGPASPRAALLRAADSTGLARGGAWRPGGGGGGWEEEGRLGGGRVVLPGGEPAPPPPSPPPPSPSTGNSGRRVSVAQRPGREGVGGPLPASAPHTRPRWGVALGETGLLLGTGASDRSPPGPAVSPAISRTLGRLLDADWPRAAGPDPHTGAPPAWGPRGPPHPASLTRAEAASLLSARGPDLEAVLAAADALRARTLGGGAGATATASFVVNRNINYTNLCTRSCDFCAFSAATGAPPGRRSGEEGHGSPPPPFPSASGGAPATAAAAEAPYFHSPAAIAAASAEAWAAGATEVCMQGGIHPAFEAEGVAAYERLVAAAKAGAPSIHVHALSPLEVWTAAGGDPGAVPAVLARLAGAGLGSLPGTAAEVLSHRVRARLFPGGAGAKKKKVTARQWLRVMRDAHALGLRSTSTLMFGSANDGPAEWAAHLAALRALQGRTGGFTEFVPLPFVPDLAPGFAAGRLRSGPTRRDCLAVTAVARLFFLGSIDHVQASWPKLGPAALPRLLGAGADDAGGVLMSESISKAAGAGFGSGLAPTDLAAAAVAAGRIPVVRTTLYGRAPPERVAAAFGGVEAARAAGVEVGAETGRRAVVLG